MAKTLHDDEVPDIGSEDDEEEVIEKYNEGPREPVIRFESIPHKGSVNRLRSMYGSPIVATWNDEGEVGIYNIQAAVQALDEPAGAEE